MQRKSVIFSLIEFSQRHSRAVIVLSIIITIFLGFFATKTKMNPDFSSLLPPDNISNQNFNTFYGDNENPENLTIIIQGDSFYTPEAISTIETVVEQLEAIDNISPGIHPFSMITAENKSGRLVMVPISPHTDSSVPWTQEEVDVFKKRLLADAIARNLTVSEDGRTILLYFPTHVLQNTNEEQVMQLREITAPISEFATVYLNGAPLITDRIYFYLVKDLFQLLAISVLVILIVYYLSFHAKRAVLLPMSIIIMGTVWCLGIMALLGYSLTIINIITPPLVVTLGSSYSIHILSGYYRKRNPQADSTQWITEAVEHVAKTIVVACITTIAGFLSLIFAEIPQFQEFGVSTSLGILATALLSLFFLPAILIHLSFPKEHQKKLVHMGMLSRIIRANSKIVIRKWYIILAIFIAIIGGFIAAFPQIHYETDYSRYFTKDDPIITSQHVIADNIGGVDAIYITLEAPGNSGKYFLEAEILKKIEQYENSLRQVKPEITHALSFVSYIKFLNHIMTGSSEIPDTNGLVMLMYRYFKLISGMDSANNDLNLLINEDATQITLAFRYKSPNPVRLSNISDAQAVIEAMRELTSLLPEECTYTIWGQSDRYLALSSMMKTDQQRTTLISLLVVFIITAITFRSLGYGLFSLIPILTGIMANFIFMWAFQISFDMVTIAFSSVTVGVGIDDAIHFILQFKTIYNPAKHNHVSALSNTINITGRPITLTSVSIISGLLVLTLASFIPIRYFGVLIAVALFDTLIATLFVLPACIIIWFNIRDRVFYGIKRQKKTH